MRCFAYAPLGKDAVDARNDCFGGKFHGFIFICMDLRRAPFLASDRVSYHSLASSGSRCMSQFRCLFCQGFGSGFLILAGLSRANASLDRWIFCVGQIHRIFLRSIGPKHCEEASSLQRCPQVLRGGFFFALVLAGIARMLLLCSVGPQRCKEASASQR